MAAEGRRAVLVTKAGDNSWARVVTVQRMRCNCGTHFEVESKGLIDELHSEELSRPCGPWYEALRANTQTTP